MIEFHCPFCGKQIRTADEHAGKHGKCPSCHQSVYIPTPEDRIEPLPIAPIDEEFERDRQRLLDETRQLQHRLLHERDLPEERGRPPPSDDSAPPTPAVDVEPWVAGYVKARADGALDSAGRLAAQARRHTRELDEVVQRMTADEIPPTALARVPRPVLIGFLKQLRG